MSKPLLFITGFLGAGKTTLLRALLDEYKRLDLTADVILNDFENAEIDASTLPESEASVFPLAASCACCDSLDELKNLCLAAQTGRGDALFIELNGTADPLPLLEAFTVMEKEMPFSPRWQVAVVDARYWRKRKEFDALETRQVETATHWILTHREGLSDEEIDLIVQSVEETNQYATRIDASRLAGEIEAAAMQPLRAKEDSSWRVGESGGEHLHDHEHALSHRFTGCQIPLPGRYRSSQMVRFLESLPAEVLRAKALVKLSEAPGYRWIFERTGRHPVGEPLKGDIFSKASPSLVCIGPALDPVLLREMVREHFGI
ncbi:MAG: GTP-binding protein [Verrucomicrobiales bacterium]|nr:GTP-binding protein [Verrucomicrobiales bacterium]